MPVHGKRGLVHTESRPVKNAAFFGIMSKEYNTGNIPHTKTIPLLNREKELVYMKATGIVRRIDDLGRVVIPKEIRRTLRIREGDPLEIYTAEDGSVILRKYSAIGELGDFASQYAESLAKTSGHVTCITDRDSVIAISGAPKKDYLSKRISRQLEKLIEERATVVAKSKSEGLIPILEDEPDKYVAQVITPIVADRKSVV